MSSHISIPCSYEDKILTIKALGLTGKGDSPDQAILACIKNTNMYIPLMLSKYILFTDSLGRTFSHIEVAYEQSIIDRITEVEPFNYSGKKQKNSSLILSASAEDVVKLGY